jgi:ABC-type Fe3+ transport system substrate-binding protein
VESDISIWAKGDFSIRRLHLIPLTVRTLNLLSQVGAIEIVDWAKLGIPPELIKEQNDGVRVYSLLFTAIYNRSLVSAEQAPRTYRDLLDPKWRGKLVLFGMGAPLSVLVPVLGEKEAYAFLRELMDKQKPILVSSNADVRNRVASGEFSIGFGSTAYKAALGDVGVENAILDKINVKPQFAGVIKNTRNPAAAKAMTYFLCCTREGKSAYYKVVGVADTNAANTEAWDIGGEGREVVATTEWQAKEETRVAIEIDKILGVR